MNRTPQTCAAVTLLAITLGTSPAYAHAFLVRANPAVGSTVTTAPKFLTLTFTENLEVAFCKVSVTNAAGANEAAGSLQPVPGHPDELLVPLDPAASGKITVAWHALSVDTHKTQGKFAFTIKP
jgi:methionine-rich copper-binding protein CopC